MGRGKRVRFGWLKTRDQEERLLNQHHVNFGDYPVSIAEGPKDPILAYMAFAPGNQFHRINVNRGHRTALTDDFAKAAFRAFFKKNPNARSLKAQAMSFEQRQEAPERFCERMGGERYVDEEAPHTISYRFHRGKFVD